MKYVDYVDYTDRKHAFFAQYCAKNAGYYPGISRRARREAEIAAHQDGMVQRPALLPGPYSSGARRICGAPGLIGAADPAAIPLLRAAAYPAPGMLP